MTAFIIYLVRSALYLTVFSAFFLLVTRRSKHFHFNRAVLLSGTVLCLVLPLLPVHTAGPTLLDTLPSAPAAIEEIDVSAPTAAIRLQWPILAAGLWLVGVLVVLAVNAVSYIRMIRLFRSAPFDVQDGCRLYLLDRDVASFSWMHRIVMSRNDYEAYPAIFSHERAHVACGHSWDMLFFSFLTAFQWFNPLVWVCRNELQLLHEYEADAVILGQGIDGTQYQKLLIRKAVGESQFLQANGFNHAQLKLRLAQLRRPSQSGWRRAVMLLVLPLLAGITLLTAEPIHPANFVNGVQFVNWLYDEIHYPRSCRKAGVEGRILLDFKLDTEGYMHDIKLLGTLHPDLDAEILRAARKSPRWIPQEKDGKPVEVTYICPLDLKPPRNEKP